MYTARDLVRFWANVAVAAGGCAGKGDSPETVKAVSKAFDDLLEVINGRD